MTNIIRIPPKTRARVEARYNAVHGRFDVVESRLGYLAASAFPAAWAYWKLDETTGTRLDSSGNGNHLSNIVGSVSYDASGIIDPYCLKVVQSGVDAGYSCVTKEDAQLDLRSDAPFTIVCWVKHGWSGEIDGLNFNPLECYYYVPYDMVSKAYLGMYASSPQDVAYYGGEAGDIVSFAPACDGTAWFSSDNYEPIPTWHADSWHFYVFRWTGTHFYLEVDNFRYDQRESSESYISNIMPSISIGLGGAPGYANYRSTSMILYVAHAGIWIGDNALTDAQLTQLYNSGAGWSPY